jgi:hypothetical protein
MGRMMKNLIKIDSLGISRSLPWKLDPERTFCTFIFVSRSAVSFWCIGSVGGADEEPHQDRQPEEFLGSGFRSPQRTNITALLNLD